MNDTQSGTRSGRQVGKVFLNVAGLAAACAAMCAGMRREAAGPRQAGQTSRQAIAAATEAVPSDFGAMPAPLCRDSLCGLRREYDRAGGDPVSREIARADYNALAVQAPAGVLRADHLPSRLP